MKEESQHIFFSPKFLLQKSTVDVFFLYIPVHTLDLIKLSAPFESVSKDKKGRLRRPGKIDVHAYFSLSRDDVVVSQLMISVQRIIAYAPLQAPQDHFSIPYLCSKLLLMVEVCAANCDPLSRSTRSTPAVLVLCNRLDEEDE